MIGLRARGDRQRAVIGASAIPGSLGYRTLQNTAFGYTAKVYIARISKLASDQRRRLAELDVNPILASADRVVAVDAMAVIAAPGGNG